MPNVALDEKLVIPAVLALLVGWLVKLIVGANGSHRQQRREFLELWQNRESTDDVWLEVCVRHLMGFYLPHRVIRFVLESSQPAADLRDISSIWNYLEFDDRTEQVRWKAPRHSTKWKVSAEIIGLLLFYFLLAMSAIVILGAAIKLGQTATNGWMFGIISVALLILAGAAMARAVSLGDARKSAPLWIERINTHFDPAVSTGIVTAASRSRRIKRPTSS